MGAGGGEWIEQNKTRILGRKLLLNESSHRTNKISLITLSSFSVWREANNGTLEKHKQLLVASVGGKGFQATVRAVNAYQGSSFSQPNRKNLQFDLGETYSLKEEKNYSKSPLCVCIKIFFLIKKQIACFPIFHEKSFNALRFIMVEP